MEINQPTPIVPLAVTTQILPPSQPQPTQLPNNMIGTNNAAPSPAIVNNTNNPLHVHNNSSNNNSKLSSSAANLSMSQFTDPLEHTLASLEQPQLNIPKNQDINSMLMDLQKQHQQQQQQLQMNQLMSQIPVTHPSNPNNFGADFNGVNGLMNILGIQSVESANLQLLNQQMKGQTGRFPDVWNVPNSSLPINPMTSRNNNPPNWEHQQAAAAMKHDKIILTPKPIQELLANVNEKPKLINTNAPDLRVNPAFAQSFKYEPNLKNANSWSQLASQETMNTSSKTKPPSDTFQEFRTKAKEQQQRQKQEAEKIKRQQKEQELKRQQESLQKQTKLTTNESKLTTNEPKFTQSNQTQHTY